MRKFLRRICQLTALLALFVLTAGLGTAAYFHYAPPAKTCLTCHEMAGAHEGWAASAHKDVHCRSCHGGALTTDLHALEAHADRVVGHFSGAAAEAIRLTEPQVRAIAGRCGACHQQEQAEHRRGGHAMTYAAAFLDAQQNQTERLAADCLRCHGMHYGGEVGQLVTPLDTKGPWKLTPPELANEPAITCLACHQVHRAANSSAFAATFYSRREKRHFALEHLPVVPVTHDGQAVPVSPDPRQRLCVQCHSPDAFGHNGSSDDRTPRGVHAGLSCAACHKPHSMDAKASCATCHPAASHCGLDVHTMDTTFKNLKSKHNVHFVACGDCHGGKRPETRPVNLGTADERR